MKTLKSFAQALFLFALFNSSLFADIGFPTLSGRVVDEAHLLSDTDRKTLECKLEAHEKATTNQIVVLTLTSLQGEEIEEYGYQLGRHWGIGQKGKDNGLLLIVAPNERKVRIEVGYGLEGVITDKLSHDIIQEQLLPAFKRGNFASGIENAVTVILATLNGEEIPENLKEQTSSSQSEGDGYIGLFIIIAIILYEVGSAIFFKKSKNRDFVSSLFGAGVAGVVTFFITFSLTVAAIFAVIFFFLFLFGKSSGGSSWSSSGGYSSGGSFGGGFSGGGGSFGGGGASGSW